MSRADFLELTQTAPILDVGKSMGHTDYIDYLSVEEVSEPIMRGVDCCKRPFVVMKFHVTTPNNKQHFVMQTFFQRYTDSPYNWVGCGHATKFLLIDVHSMGHTDFRLLMDVINHQPGMDKCVLTDDNRPELPVGSTVRLWTADDDVNHADLQKNDEALF